MAPSFRIAQDFQQYAASYRAIQEQALVNGAGRTASASQTASQSVPPTARREIGRYDAGFLERHNPSSKLLNSLKVITGVPGTLVVFNNGIGYVSLKQNPTLKGARQNFVQEGYLKFLVPATAVLSVRDVSVVLEPNGGSSKSSTFIVEVDIDRNSEFFQPHKALLSESEQDNRLFFTVRDRSTLTLLLSQAPRGMKARDAF